MALPGRLPIVDLRAILQALWLPAVVALAAALLVALPGKAGPLIQSVPSHIVIGAALIGALLGWRFDRSRAVFALIVLLLVYLVMHRLVARPPGPDVVGQVLYPGVCVLLPVNLLLIAQLDERGLLTLAGLSRLGLIFIEVVVLAALVWAPAPALQSLAAAFLHWRLLPAALDLWTYLPQPALIAFLIAGAMLIGRTAYRPGPLEAALLSALVVTGVALHQVGYAPVPELYLSAAMLTLGLAVVQEGYHMAFLDELTGLPGRRALLHQMKKLSGPYAVAMVDIDHFKSFNDAHGHDAGDQVLKLVAGCLARARGAKAFRYGGEEFTLLYPGLDAEAARSELESVRASVAASPFRRRGKDRPKRRPRGAPRRPGGAAAGLSVTVSIGVAQLGHGGQRPDEVLKAADLALYGAKRAGRNRIEVYRQRRQRWQRPG